VPRGAQGDTPRVARRQLAGGPRAAPRAFLGACLLAAAALWAIHLRATGPAAGLFHDGGVYLVTARALATGAGYRRVSEPAPPAEVRYPPLLPLALAAVWRAAPRFPENLVWLKAVSALAAIGLVLVLPGYLRACGIPPGAATATAALTAIAPLTTRYATAVASELPFALLAVAALWATASATRSGRPVPAAGLAGLLAGLAFLTRTVGVAVVAAGLFTVWARAGRRRALAFALGAAACALPWTGWLVAHGDASGDQAYLTALVRDGFPGPGRLLLHLLQLPAAVGLVILPGLADLPPTHATAGAAGLAYACGLVALVAVFRHPFRGYVGLSLAIAVAVPWFQPRFLVPLAPFLLAALLTTVLPVAAGPRARAIRGLVVGGLVLGAVLGNQVRLTGVLATRLPALEQASLRDVEWREVDATLGWLSRHTAPGDVLASFHDPLLHLYTGRSAVQAYPALWRPDGAQVDAALARSGARFLVDLPCPEGGVWTAARVAWRRWLAAHADSLRPVYTAPGGRARVWRIDTEEPPPSPTAHRDPQARYTPRMLTVQAEPRPITCARPSRAPGTCRSPACSRRWSVSSKRFAIPVAPSGCPFESRPPETFTGTRPPWAVSPSSTSRPASPAAQSPRFS
jgi:hypothetical protein